MPDAPDDEPTEPLQVMRKRRNGVYRADTGFSGPTRRYVLIVALLVLLASVPTAAAITAGTNELADGKSDTLDIPVLPPASPGPVRGTGPGGYDRPPPPSSSARSSMQGQPVRCTPWASNAVSASSDQSARAPRFQPSSQPAKSSTNR